MKKYIISSFISILTVVSIVSFTSAAEYTFSRDLTVGASGDDVTALQTWLISNGYDIPAISASLAHKGYFGSQTRQALMKYQLSVGIPNTGYFGPMTRGRIHGNHRDNSLIVTSPNGGEIWRKGIVENITWTAPAYPNATFANILLVPYQVCPTGMACVAVPPKVIAGNINISQNSYSWRVGEYYDASDNNPNAGIKAPVSDGQYTIQVCEVGTNKCDSSDQSFTIVSSPNQTPTLKITSPNGDEVWKSNSTHQISWYLNGADGKAKVDLYLQQADVNCVAMVGAVCDVKTHILDKNIPASSIYNWIVATDINNATIPPGNYIVRVCTSGSLNDCDFSDRPFTIVFPTSSLLQVCPTEKIINKMPTIYPNQNSSSTYYILNGVRRELTEFDQNWVGTNCAVPIQTVY